MITSHMQQLKTSFEGPQPNKEGKKAPANKRGKKAPSNKKGKKALSVESENGFKELKPTFPHLWEPIGKGYLATADQEDSESNEENGTPQQATIPSRNNVLHPFLAYLLGSNDGFFADPSTAFCRPAMDVSQIEAPTAFWNGWDACREEIRRRDQATKAKKAEGEASTSTKKYATATMSNVLDSPTPARPAIKRKRAVEVSTPSKKRVVIASEAVSHSVSKVIKVKNTAKASAVSSYNDDETDELDSSEYGDDDEEEEDSSDEDGDDPNSVASRTLTPSDGGMRALVAASYYGIPPSPTRPFWERLLLSAIPRTSNSQHL